VNKNVVRKTVLDNKSAINESGTVPLGI